MTELLQAVAKRRPPWSARTTGRRSARCTRSTPPACACRRTSRSSASTTSRSTSYTNPALTTVRMSARDVGVNRVPGAVQPDRRGARRGGCLPGPDQARRPRIDGEAEEEVATSCQLPAVSSGSKLDRSASARQHPPANARRRRRAGRRTALTPMHFMPARRAASMPAAASSTTTHDDWRRVQASLQRRGTPADRACRR